VLIELGYALKSLGPRRVILVQNTAFGTPEELPFDLRHKRVLTYTSAEEASERAPERRRLQAGIKEALSLVIAEVDPPLKVSDEAKRLLVAAAGGDGFLLRMESLIGTSIQAGREQMTKPGDRREEARWDAAIQEFGLAPIFETTS